MKLDLSKLAVTTLFVGLFVAPTNIVMAAGDEESKSSCVTCHLDEEMLAENLAAAKGKKSAMQSGKG